MNAPHRLDPSYVQRAVLLRSGAAVTDPLEVALGFLEAYGVAADDPSPRTFGEEDLRRANRGGARISAAEIAAVLSRGREVSAALDFIAPTASLTARNPPWTELTRLFDAFGGIKGVGYSKMTKTLHAKRTALIPILDSVVQAYLASDDPAPPGFGERATALVRSYKQDLDRNRAALRDVRRGLARRGYALTEVRILDLLIWSAFS